MRSRNLRRPAISPIVEEPSVLVLQEKHGDRYFYVASDKALFTTALAIVKERNSHGQWYPQPPGQAPAVPDVRAEDIPKLPKSLQEAAKKKLREYTNEKRLYDEEIADYQEIQKAIATDDGKLAWEILHKRRDYEYEGILLEIFEDPTTLGAEDD